MKTAAEKVEAYIEKKGDGWKKETLLRLREYLLRCDVEEGVKWGAPTYINNGNVVSFAAFKNHIALWFYQGVFLKDDAGVLETSDGSSKAMRQWRFHEGDELNEGLIITYVEEAIANMKAGKKLKPERVTEAVELPSVLVEALERDPELKSAFGSMSLSHRNEYASYIGEAKKEETALRRLNKSLEYIRQSLDLNHKYRK